MPISNKRRRTLDFAYDWESESGEESFTIDLRLKDTDRFGPTIELCEPGATRGVEYPADLIEEIYKIGLQEGFFTSTAVIAPKVAVDKSGRAVLPVPQITRGSKSAQVAVQPYQPVTDVQPIEPVQSFQTEASSPVVFYDPKKPHHGLADRRTMLSEARQSMLSTNEADSDHEVVPSEQEEINNIDSSDGQGEDDLTLEEKAEAEQTRLAAKLRAVTNSARRTIKRKGE